MKFNKICNLDHHSRPYHLYTIFTDNIQHYFMYITLTESVLLGFLSFTSEFYFI